MAQLTAYRVLMVWVYEAIDKRRLAADVITPLTTWPAIRDEALQKHPPSALSAQRSEAGPNFL